MMDGDNEFYSFLDLMTGGNVNPIATMEEGAPSHVPVEGAVAENPVMVDAAMVKHKVGARKRVRTVTREKKSNFSAQEDLLTVRSWLQISCDPMTNTGQKKDKFWDRIVAQFNKNRGAASERSLRSLQSRWDIIKAEANKYSKYYYEAVRINPSGMTDSDKTSMAAANFAETEGYPFAFLHCWKILKDEPKFQDVLQPRPGGDDQRQEASNDVNLSHDQSSPTPTSVGKRPMGRDAAKAAARKKAASGSSLSIASDFVANREVLNLRIDQEQSKWREQHEEYRKEKKLEREELMSIEREKIEIERKKAAAKEILAAAEQRRAAAEERKAEVLIMTEEERILSIDLDKCNPTLRAFYSAKQKQILARIAA